jgi:hypothetical protein
VTEKRNFFKRSRLGLVIGGGATSLVLALSLNPTFSGIVAQITNSGNTAATGTLTMQETGTDATGAAVTCNSTDANSNNAASCATINKYGGTATPLVPGAAPTVTSISIKNTGNIPATQFTVLGGACTQSAVSGASSNGTATDLCAKVNVVIKSGSTTIFSGTAASFANSTTDILAKLGQSSVAAGASIPLTISAQLDASAGAAYQGLQISQPITWTFQS